MVEGDKAPPIGGEVYKKFTCEQFPCSPLAAVMLDSLRRWAISITTITENVLTKMSTS